MILDKDSNLADVLYHQRCYKKFTEDFKPAESYREDKDKLEKAMTEKKVFNATKNNSGKSRILLSSTIFFD